MIRETSEGTVFEARIKTGKGRFSVRKELDIIFIEVTSPPQENRANMEIVKELSRLFGSQVRIVKGLKSKEKMILVDGMNIAGLNQLF